jgi:NAD-dependent dihydropyrimidine dehydrogenase PreA subunit
MKRAKRKIITIDEHRCNGCGQCVPSCHEGALAVVDTPDGPKARLVKESYCDGLGACLGECPTGALKIVEVEADAFDADAVHRHLESIGRAGEAGSVVPQKPVHEHETDTAETLPCGCPGTMARSWGGTAPAMKHGDRERGDVPPLASELRTWPIQLALLNPAAPYLQRADLLIAADCTAFAFGNFHREFLRDKVPAILCPKLDEIDGYAEKLERLFQDASIRSVTVVHMEVPCCFGLRDLVRTALKNSRKNIPYCEVVVGIDGTIKES